MRKSVSTRAICMASSARLASVDGNGRSGIRPRLVALLDHVLRSGGDDVRRYYATDVIVTDHNPLLAAICIHTARKAGKRVALSLSARRTDLWYYSHVASPEWIAAILNFLGLPLHQSELSLENLIVRLIGHEASNLVIIDGSLSPADRYPPGEGAFHLRHNSSSSSKQRFVDLEVSYKHSYAALVDTLRESIGSSLLLEHRAGKATAVFAPTLVLTGMPQAFQAPSVCGKRYVWHRNVIPLGSASKIPAGDGAIGDGMYADVQEALDLF